MKLGHDTNPTQRAASLEIAFTASTRIRLAMIRRLDCGHSRFKVLAHLDVLVKDMIPRRLVQLDQTALRVAYFGDDVRLGDPRRLGNNGDGTVRSRIVSVPLGNRRVWLPDAGWLE